MCSAALGFDNDALEFDELIKALYAVQHFAEMAYGKEHKYYVSIFGIERYASIDKKYITPIRYITFRVFAEDGDFLSYFKYEL